MVDHERTDAQLGGEARPECTVIAGPLEWKPEWNAESRVPTMPLVMTAYNHEMVKQVNKSLGWPASTALSMKCTLGDIPIALTVTDPNTYQNFVDFCVGRGVDSMKKQGLVNVEVKHYINPGKNKGIARAPKADKPKRPQVVNFEALKEALKGSARIEDEEEEVEVEGGEAEGAQNRSGAKVGVWNEVCNEIVAGAENGTVRLPSGSRITYLSSTTRRSPRRY